ncbi:MAG: hypothetical protein QOD27_1675 [Microbacteriaceae bacterium]|jgi:hypothetical protein|nr:hypothetical protein [Microbacteriaceae bacterium]MDQ1552977.1 hypothetical protein [Microbacteriaceae bacterium]
MTGYSELAALVSGPVLTASEPGFADEVAAFISSTTHTPDVVVGATSPHDVVQAVRFARSNRLPVRVQSTGHGAFAPIAAGMLVTTNRLNDLDVDHVSRIAAIGAGVRWAAVVEAAAEHGLAPITGSSPNVGAVGFLAGGGLGPLSRSHGFASDYIRGFSVVTGDGELREATSEENPDLFWALRGGKGGLGIVTEVRVELVELSSLYGGALFFEEQHIDTVLRAWIDWTATAPDDVTTSVGIFRLPPFDFIPEPLRGRTVIALRFARPGTAGDGERIAAPLRSIAPVYLDLLGELPPGQIGAIHNDPTDPGPGWDRGMLLTGVDQDFATALLSQVGSGRDVPFLLAEMRHLGGATRTDVAGGSAVGGRASDFTFSLIGVPDVSLFDTVLPEVSDRIVTAIGPWVSPETNINFAGRPRSYEHFVSAWPAVTFERLASVRRRYDPDGVLPYGPVRG